MGTKIGDRDYWFDLWFEDKKSMIDTMVRNMTADLAAGYDYFGKAIRDQKQEIERYKTQLDNELDMFKAMDEKAVNRWCFYDMKKRGAIE